MKPRLLKVVYYGIPVLLVAATVLLLNTGTILKRPAGDGDSVEQHLHAILNLAGSQEWDEARSTAEHVQRAWRRVRGRVHLTSTTDEIEQFDLELAGLRGALDGGDASQVHMSVRRLMALWEDLGA